MLSVKTTRFGELEIDEKRAIYFPEGIIGFPNDKRYVVLQHKPGSPFSWLQSTEKPELAFVMMNPFLVKSDYLEDLPAGEKALFRDQDKEDKILFSLVTIPRENVRAMTVNLLGPLVIDTKTQTGRQVILAGSDYDPRHPLLLE